jgi:[acyl-carrier-protein] S-malonyltransferase
VWPLTSRDPVGVLSGSKIQIANYLCPGNYAVSGSLEAAKVLEEIAKPDFGARMTVSQ